MISFLDKITPPRMLARLQKLCEQRPDIQVVRGMLGEPKFLEWAHSIGVCTDGDLRECVPPFPPREVRQWTAAADLEMFLWTGLVDMQLMLALYDEFKSVSSPTGPTVLDFGCGCGRMLRFLSGQPEHWTAYGCDVKAANADWCRDNLTGAKVARNAVLPPLPYPSGRFDLIFSLSIFSHLPEKNASLWIDEMYRLLAPQGLFIATTHGLPALEIIKQSPPHQQMIRLDRPRTEALIQEFQSTKYIFLQYDDDVLAVAQAGAEYGNTFIHPDYIRQHLDDKRFKLLRHLPGGLHGWQDIVVLQRR